ncbi:MAG: ATP-binding protein [Oligoflexia bacterium]|nr:ATP-binding protein [Oligoflexia bacterium]
MDDWGLSKLNENERKDLLEIIEDRYELRSTIITGQIPVKKWHELIGDATFADAILDRLIHNSYKIELEGDSMRKLKNTFTKDKEKKDDK